MSFNPLETQVEKDDQPEPEHNLTSTLYKDAMNHDICFRGNTNMKREQKCDVKVLHELRNTKSKTIDEKVTKKAM